MKLPIYCSEKRMNSQPSLCHFVTVTALNNSFPVGYLYKQFQVFTYIHARDLMSINEKLVIYMPT